MGANIGATTDRMEDGRSIVHVSARPLNAYTMFTGAGDNVTSSPPVMGGGPKIIFNLLATDTEKTVIVEFSTNTWIKDGLIMADNAPLGSSVSVYVLDPAYTPVGVFAINIPLLASGFCVMDSDDHALIPQTYKLAIKVTNASGQNGEALPTAFSVVGRIEMYRPLPG